MGGCHRSGTSLVRRLLNAHSRIHCGPEVKFFRDFFGDYPVDPIRHLRFTTSARSLLPEAELLTILGRAFVVLHERAAALANKPRWADKNPENVVYLSEWQRLLGDHWLFVHVVRNPLDTLASIKEARFPLTIPPELDARIVLYRRFSTAGLSFSEAYPDRCRRILYEELVHSPQPTLASLMDWLGERLEPGQFLFNATPQQSGLEDPKIAGTSGIHAASVHRWPSLLTATEARKIWDQTHDLWTVMDPKGDYVAAPSDGMG